MNSKILIAFASGALLASGIVYFAVRDEAPPKAAVKLEAISKPAPPPTPAAAPSQLAASTPAPAVPASKPAPVSLHAAAPIREKPSPMPPPVPHDKPVTIAQNQIPPEPAESPASPAPAPPQVAKPADPQPAVETPTPAPSRSPAPAQVELQPAPPLDNPPPPPAPEIRSAPTVTIAAGTILSVRIGETISAAHYENGDTFLATLDQPLVVDGWIIAERGSRLEGRVVAAVPPSRGNASRLEIELVKLSTADGQHIQIRTQPYKKGGTSSAGHDAAKLGAGTAIGAAIGAAAGGGKGAAIGAGIGAAAGIADVVLTRPKPAEIPVETRISFRIADPVTITERLN